MSSSVLFVCVVTSARIRDLSSMVFVLGVCVLAGCVLSGCVLGGWVLGGLFQL